jgi:hypothetical protein
MAGFGDGHECASSPDRQDVFTFAVAGVAQLVEQRIRNAKVEGSTPFTGTTAFKQKRQPLRLAFLFL